MLTPAPIINPHIRELIERFGLVAFPAEHLERLDTNRPYNVEAVYNRLTELGVLNCELEYFRHMLEHEPGYTLHGADVFRHIIDPDVFIIDPELDE